MDTGKTSILRKKYQISSGKRLVREAARSTFKTLFHLLSRVKISGQENVPSHGRYLVVFNHVSIYDPPMVVAFWPYQLEILGAVEVWSRKGQGFLARLWGGIPIHRDDAHREAFVQTLTVLRSDLPLLMSPEGGRSHLPGLRKAKTGIVYLAESTQATIVPVGLTGTTDDFFQRAIHGQRPGVDMAIGKPFTLPNTLDDPDIAPREIRQRKADYIMKRVAELLPVTYRGYYV